jgi:two-component system cell cycle sensor histidine kinase/response regulator CckA
MPMPPHDRKLLHPPAVTGQVAEDEPALGPFPQRPGVLVADDEHFVRSMLQLGLERYGFDVWMACDGREALLLYRAHRERIDVVLLDVRMPVLDGPGTLDALRELNPDVLAYFLTGDTGPYDPQELLRRGAARIIIKPFHIDELASNLWILTRGMHAGVPSSGGGSRE